MSLGDKHAVSDTATLRCLPTAQTAYIALRKAL